MQEPANMATATVPIALKGSVGGYKDIQPVKYEKEKELLGTGDFAPATYPAYLPTWVSRSCTVI